MLHRSVLVGARASVGARSSAAATSVLAAAPAAVAAVQCASRGAASAAAAFTRAFSSATPSSGGDNSSSRPSRPNLPSRPAAPRQPASASGGLERADHRPSGRTRGYASNDTELEARALVLARDRASYDDIVGDALHIEDSNARARANTLDLSNLPPSFKTQANSTRYTNEEIPGYAFVPPKNLNDPRAVHGVGTPQQQLVQRPRPRREWKPKSVQDVPTPMKTYTDGPRELGNTIVRTYVGHVVSDKMQKTVAVEVSQYYRHPKYHKYIKTSRKFLTHDEEEECNVGDVVEIRVCRPMSRRKHFTLHKILKPKLLIEEGARRFENNMPEWQKPGLEEADRVAIELQRGEEALQLERERAEQKAQALQAKKAAEEGLPAALDAATDVYKRLEDEAASAARALTELRDSLSPIERESSERLIQVEQEALDKASQAIIALEEVNRIKSSMKPKVWASS